jgi:hypothetical protein
MRIDMVIEYPTRAAWSNLPPKFGFGFGKEAGSAVLPWEPALES